MKKKKFNYLDFSNKELEYIKDYYITEKVKNMNESELRKFAHEIVSHQVKNTIGDEEEREAWEEMACFFSDNFESILESIKKKFEATNQDWEIEAKTNSTNAQAKDNDEIKNEKIDMWMD
tara:strand:+ start:1962 stop:2321 length:360 start_codon:yes stop_codon:yes gene_type:complete